MFVCFLGIDCTVLDSFYLVLLIVTRLKLWLILMVFFCHLASVPTNINDILKIAACHLAKTLTNIDDKAENLAIYYQAYIYRSDNTFPISYPSLKASQLCQDLIEVLKQSKRTEFSIVMI